MIRRNSMELPVRKKRITVIYAVIAVVHCVLIFLPLWYFELRMPKTRKVDLFRVKIGPQKLSSGPVVGPPERRPFSPPEPEIARPEPATPQPKIAPPKPQPAKEPKIVKKKTQPKPVKEPKIARKQTKKVQKPVKNTPKKTTRKPVKPKRRQDDGVFQSEPAITNPKVPVGSQNRWQTKGKKPDNNPPGGGAEADMAEYGKKLEHYVYMTWKQPPQSRIGDSRPETVVSFIVTPAGKVLSARIVEPSRNPAMEESVRAFLLNLELLPKPPYQPGGRPIEIKLVLKTK